MTKRSTGGSMQRAAGFFFLVLTVVALRLPQPVSGNHDYADALEKSILFFEGQRSGKLPASQRMDWRRDSALHDGNDIGVDLVGGYYDAGDNVKFGFPMAFTTTVLAWGVVEFGWYMGPQLRHARDALRWATDYLLKATADPTRIHVQVGDPFADHACWERPEDMDTPRTVYTVDAQNPGSEVAGETAAALAAASIVFSSVDRAYAAKLLKRSIMVFGFADAHRGSYNPSVGPAVSKFYGDFSGYKDELVWAAAWIYKATKNRYYRDYVAKNIQNLYQNGGNVGEFGWDDKHAGIYVLVTKNAIVPESGSPQEKADAFVCTVLPESPSRTVDYSPGGLLFKSGGSNMQHPTTLSFLLAVYARHLTSTRRTVHCGGTAASPSRLIQVAKSQIDYILGDNPLNMSYMVGYGSKFPQRIHHRASSLPSLARHPGCMGCQDGSPYYQSPHPNPNLLTGAVVGGPNYISDAYLDSRPVFVQSEPATYINAPLVGVLAYLNSRP